MTLTKRSQLYLPKAFFDKYVLNHFKAAKLFYDGNKKVIAILFVPQSIKGITFKITMHTMNIGATLHLASFLKANKIDPALYHGVYHWKKYYIPNEGEAFIIELAAAGE